jgi:hypothetical protein
MGRRFSIFIDAGFASTTILLQPHILKGEGTPLVLPNAGQFSVVCSY